MISSAGCRPEGVEIPDIVIIGCGRMGLSLGYYLHRAKGDCLILVAGGTWRHIWNFLRLSSPASYGSLPDWLMPLPAYEGYPTRDEVLDLTDSTMPNNHQISVMAAYRRKPPVTTIKAYIAVTTRK